MADYYDKIIQEKEVLISIVSDECPNKKELVEKHLEILNQFSVWIDERIKKIEMEMKKNDNE